MKDIKLLDLKTQNGIGNEWIEKSMCGNCHFYNWENGVRHKGDCTKRDEKGERTDNSRSRFLPQGIHALTGAENCTDFVLNTDEENQSIIQIFDFNNQFKAN